MVKGERAAVQDVAAALVPDALLTVRTVATLCGVHPQTIYEWVRDGLFPAPLRRGRRFTRWRAEAVMQWLRERAQAAA